jgi:glycosyltransferase involved in cell wall biosynthesis
MSRRPKVLCLLPGVPLPANRGGALRALNALRALDQSFELSVLAWAREGEDGAALARLLEGSVRLVRRPAAIDALLEETAGVAAGLPAGYSRYRWHPLALRKLLETQSFDVVHFDHPHTALSWELVRKLQPQAALVLDAHNVEALVIERLAQSRPLWQRRPLFWQARRIRALEREIAREMDLVITCSEEDAQTFAALGARRVCVVPNGVPPISRSMVAQRRDLVFVGSFDWRPNTDAAGELAREIWPRCRDLLPGARLVLVGHNPPPAILSLAARDVIVTGSVPSVQPFLDRAFATAIPLRAGSGTRIKILEAWAAGVPVVACRMAAEGLPYRDGVDLLLAENPDEFARALVRLWRERPLADRLIAEGQYTVAPFTADRIAETVRRRYHEELGI